MNGANDNRRDVTEDSTTPPGDDDAVHSGEQPAAESAADDRYLRLAADFENFKRRRNQELLDRARYANEDAARAMLPVLDNLRRAVEHGAESGGSELLDGLELVVREFESALESLGVTPVVAEGQPFDPSMHEAIGGEESPDVDVDTVATELQRGYRLHDRLLRPSLVRVTHPLRAGSTTGSQ